MQILYTGLQKFVTVVNPRRCMTFPCVYAKLLEETRGWVFWDYQFQNILKLFTVDQRLPALIPKEYRKDRTRVIRILTYLKTCLGIIYGVLV